MRQKGLYTEKGGKREMEEKLELLPENQMQDLWELNGRVKAAIQYLNGVTYPDRKTLVLMLGGDANGLSVSDGNKD